VVESFKDLSLDLNFDTGVEGSDVTKKFYVPVLQRATSYDRVAGYFSSAALSNAARGIAGLVRNSGRMRLITSHALQKYDVDALQNFFSSEEFANKLSLQFETSYNRLKDLGDAVSKNHISAMCWMLKNNFLDIRVIVPVSAELQNLTAEELEKFHPKFGILEDSEQNSIAFVGSINETASAWRRNIENFEVFQSWQPGFDAQRIESRKKRFADYWSDNIGVNWKTISLPDAVKIRLIEQYAPDDFPYDMDEEPIPSPSSGLRNYQKSAMQAWIDAGRRGLFEMATATGKTRTAKACIESTMELGGLLTLVVAPYSHIATQWGSELKKHDPYSVSSSWRKDIPELALESERGWRENLTIIAVQNTAASSEFVQLMEQIMKHFSNFLIVADEVHWLGARSYQPAMMKSANFRLGLSATPSRYFDEEGTEEIFNYFGQTVFEFPLREALKVRDEKGNRILCDYEYHPSFVDLSAEELENYRELTKIINAMVHSKNAEELKKKINDLRIERAKIVKSAVSKIPELRRLIQLMNKPIKHMLIYCADDSQLDAALEILNEFSLSVQKITGQEGSTPQPMYGGLSERQHLIKTFADGKLDVLLAIRCLDEGVDIPEAKTSIILASSGNTKEFIQRRGRLMRPYPGKVLANIYDICVLPEDPADRISGIWEKEKSRILGYSEDALNFDAIKSLIARM